MTHIRRLASAVLLLFVFSLPLFCSAISFSGGHTSISLQDGNRIVSLTGGASVDTDEVSIRSDSVEIYGEGYRYVSCTGNVQAKEKERKISFRSPSVFYDRQTGIVSSDSWIEIQDPENQAALSGAWFEYNMEKSLMKLRMMARILKVTDEGLMVCRADLIEYDGKKNTVTLRGNASVEYKGDTYKAALIMVNLDTDEISLYGTVSGEFNG